MTSFSYTPPRILDISQFADAEGFLDGRISLLKGDCLEWLDRLPENYFDGCITDPPYHYQTIVDRFGGDGAAEAQEGSDGAFKRASAGFMGKTWDGGDIAFRRETWAKVLRVLKPGAHIAAFSAPKCVHKMAMAIEAAGFEVRDRIVHFYDPDPAVIAFLDSLSPAQADALFRLDDAFGALGEAFWCFGTGFPKSHDVSKAIDKALTGINRGAAGKIKQNTIGQPAKGVEYERTEKSAPITAEAAEWEGWGSALKPAYEPIVIARKPLDKNHSIASQAMATGTGGINIDASRIDAPDGVPSFINGVDRERTRSSYDTGGSNRTGKRSFAGRFPANLSHDSSQAAIEGLEERFFYSAKANANDRLGSGHPTVKPVDLMQWLCRMLCPKGGLIVDVFSGTGTTGEAAYREGMSAALIEREPEYHADIERRMELVLAGPRERQVTAAKAKAERRSTESLDHDAIDFVTLMGGEAPPVTPSDKSTENLQMKTARNDSNER